MPDPPLCLIRRASPAARLLGLRHAALLWGERTATLGPLVQQASIYLLWRDLLWRGLLWRGLLWAAHAYADMWHCHLCALSIGSLYSLDALYALLTARTLHALYSLYWRQLGVSSQPHPYPYPYPYP